MNIFSVDIILKTILSKNQIVRAEQLLTNTRENFDDVLDLLVTNSHNWNIGRIGKTEKTSLILGISELMMNLTPKKVVVSEWTKLTDKHASSDGAKFVNAILDNISKKNESV